MAAILERRRPDEREEGGTDDEVKEEKRLERKSAEERSSFRVPKAGLAGDRGAGGVGLATRLSAPYACVTQNLLGPPSQSQRRAKQLASGLYRTVSGFC